MKDYIFDIQRFCVKDGPGIRTTVFVKGCPLNCLWCHNPESKQKSPQLAFDSSKCLGCGSCVSACANGAIVSVGSFDKSKCTLCGECVKECAGALEIFGREAVHDEVMANVLADKAFYENSGGGLTVSGGEPLYSPEFTTQLLKKAKEQGIHTCLETSGFAKWENLRNIASYVDLFLFDIKETDSDLHKQYTGVDNELILQNLLNLNEIGAKIVLRCPIIPGYNDREGHFKAIGELADRLENVSHVDILPYHSLGKSKSRLIGQEYAVDADIPNKERVDGWLKNISSYTHKKVVIM
jgi:pyruvate formate lyase activating enzyme